MRCRRPILYAQRVYGYPQTKEGATYTSGARELGAGEQAKAQWHLTAALQLNQAQAASWEPLSGESCQAQRWPGTQVLFNPVMAADGACTLSVVGSGTFRLLRAGEGALKPAPCALAKREPQNYTAHAWLTDSARPPDRRCRLQAAGLCEQGASSGQEQWSTAWVHRICRTMRIVHTVFWRGCMQAFCKV